MTRLCRDFVSRYFDKSLDLHIQVFNLLGCTGMAAGIIVAAISFAQKAGAVTVVFNLIASALAIILLRLTGEKISYRAASWFVIVVVFFVVFPVLFFAIGGYRSGMPSFFIFAIVFTFILLERKERFAALTVEFAVYIGCCLIAYYFPQTVPHFQKEIYYVSDIITGIIVSGVLILMVFLLYIRMYNARELQIKELNRELEARNETLVKYDQMKSDFLAAVAHEISKPLTVIVGSSADTMELLKESPVNMDEIAENHERIEKKALLIDGIVADLMDTVAIESGRLPLSRQLIRLSELLQSVCETGFRQPNPQNNRIVLALEEKLPPLWADPGRIEQVITNILANAVRHTQSGTITVKLTRSEKGQTVSVSDDGEGMEPEMAETALKKYATSSGENWRHGYGLYICRQIILAHGGEIEIESKKGCGTTVTFTIAEKYDD